MRFMNLTNVSRTLKGGSSLYSLVFSFVWCLGDLIYRSEKTVLLQACVNVAESFLEELRGDNLKVGSN